MDEGLWFQFHPQLIKDGDPFQQFSKPILDSSDIHWPEILPLTAIVNGQNEKTKRFREQQLQQGFKKSKGISI